MAKTYYDTLQVSRYASASVIRAAYKALSQKHHPDKNPDSADAAHLNMKRLNEAYDVLSSESRKAAYDELLEELERRPPQSPPAPPPRPPSPPQPAPSSARPQATARETESERARDPDSARRRYSYNAKPDGSNQPKRIRGLTVLQSVLSSVLAVGGIAIFSALTKPAVEATAATRAEPPSRYARCAGAAVRAECERIEDELAKEGTAAAASRAKKLDAERAKNLQLANAKLPSATLATLGASQIPVPAVSPPKVVVPVVARKRDYNCMSTVTLNLNSTNYSGIINVELRVGTRPGSAVLEQFEVFSSGVVKATNVCPGTYFFAFATADAPAVSTTQYFHVEQDSERYSMPEITVTYSRSDPGDSRPVGVASRNAL